MKRWFLFVLMLGGMAPILAFTPFKVTDIRIEGLQRISAGTVFNYLPVKVGDNFTQKTSANAVRALFNTGFFKDVRIDQQNTVLVVVLVERPSIATITIVGNKGVADEVLKENFKKLEFVEGQTFNDGLLDKIEQELRRIFFSEGKYGVKIKSTITPLPRNRVAVEINISEGVAAKIKTINIIGNKKFDEKQLHKQFTLRTPGAFTFYTKNDQYSKQKLGGDLEKLQTFYHDRGYLDFQIKSTQVSISPDKRDIYITVNIQEGEEYRVKDIKLAGRLVVDAKELKGLVSISKGSIFSLKDVNDSGTKIKDRLADDGYAFARINPNPEMDKKNKLVSVTLFIDPGRRVYVRRIVMVGNLRTSDLVLRREMRQLEGAWYSAKLVQRSQVRLQRLGFFTTVDAKTKPVSGTNDQIDIEFTVKEKPSGNFLASIGYSSTSGAIFQISVEQDNFLGTGKKFGIALNKSDINQGAKITYVNPYYTPNGVSRGFSLKYEETDAAAANLADYRIDEASFFINYSIPINEYDRFLFGIGSKLNTLHTTPTTSAEVLGFINLHGEKYNNHIVTLGLSHDTRNKAIFADRGVLHRLTGEISTPGSDLQFYKIRYQYHQFLPLTKRLTFSLKGEMGYGDGYGDTIGLPFYENFYAGGIKSVRGFRDNTLGPRDTNLKPVGGAYKTVGSMEVIFPPPFAADSKAFRLGAFVDFGNVFKDQDTFDSKELRASAGISFIWISPIGPLALSFATPIKEKVGDEIQELQFSLGGAFF